MFPKVGLSLMPEQDYLTASCHLFESGEVDIIEWSFDMCWGKTIPPACYHLLKQYSDADCLLGHGVSFSLLTAKQTQRQKIWLQYLQAEMSQFNYQKISEHFGFMTTEKFIQGAPLSVPFMPEMVAIGINNLQQIKEIAKVPVGIENLGFAFSKQDVVDQGNFITELLDAVDGFLLLDIHNIYCNMINFEMSFKEVCSTLPLHRVTEMHISGGSFRSINYKNKNIYCDSHDAAVPRAVFDLLEQELPKFMNVEAIIFERMGNTFFSQHDVSQFNDDFATLKLLVKKISNEKNAR